uniref:Uncharacterized protein n=1 Tax=Anguilla anguilla TaxID=7936 RepID=A0A0E9S1Z3_ANGAN
MSVARMECQRGQLNDVWAGHV